MPGGMNLASKYSNKVDERFSRESQAMLALNNDYEFTGVDTVKVYSIPVVPMTDYARSGANRYGTPDDLSRNVQTLKVTRDRAFTFIIDKGDKIQSQMVSDAGKALARQIKEVWVPEFDTYVFKTLANAAQENGNYDTTVLTKANAYEQFLKGQENLGNKNVPDTGRVCFATYGFANLLMQDPAFVKQGNASQDMVSRGVIGTVDGVKIVRVPSSRMPAGAAFLLTHPMAATAPKQLEDYKTHDNPPGISGWLVEGRVIYDCFVLNEKADAVYYHGGQTNLKVLTVGTAGSSSGKSTIMVIPGAEAGHTLSYKTGTSVDTSVSFGATVTGYTALTNGAEIKPTASHTVVTVVELDAESKVVATGSAKLNIG